MKAGPDRRYTNEFRDAAVNQVIEGERGQAAVARSLEISNNAIDISQAMLDATRARAKALGAAGIRVQRAGFLTFRLHDDSVDMATSQYALHHLNDFWKLVALQRVHRCLKAGGVLLLRDVVFSCHPSQLRDTVDAWLHWMQEERGYSRAENATHVREEHSTFSWVMEGLLERAGFRILDAKYTRGVYATYHVRKPPDA